MRVHKILDATQNWPQVAYIENEENNFRKSSKALLDLVEKSFAPTQKSLSHTQSFSFVAFTNEQTCLRVGIDAEEKRRKVLPSVKRKILKDLDCPESAELETLYIWTAKEAAFKTFSFVGATVIGEIFLEKIEGDKFEIFYVDSKQQKHSARGIWIELCDHVVAICAFNKKSLNT
jgi:hypothetical protein